MAKPRAILKRRKAVQNIAKITKTMQMIAASRFQKAFQRAVAARPYTDRLVGLVARLAAAAGTVRHPLLDRRDAVRRVALLAIASNRGLCGGYNAGVQRVVLSARAQAVEAGRSVRLLVSGRKLAGAIRYQGIAPDETWTRFEDKPAFAEVDALTSPLIDAYAKGEVDEVLVAYTKFESASRQRPVVERVLPFEVPAAAGGGSGKAERQWIFDPDAATILMDLIPRAVRLRVFQAFLDAAVSEQVARMTAMKSATDNARDMIVHLGRVYNRGRQTQITTELSEIMGGAAALE